MTHQRAHTHPTASVAPLPKLSSFLSTQPVKPTFGGHLSLVWLPPPTLAPAWQLPPPQPSGGQGPGPGAGHAWNRLMLFSWKWSRRGVGSPGQAGSLEAYILASREA